MRGVDPKGLALAEEELLIAAARRVNETHEWIRQMMVRLDRDLFGRERPETTLQPLMDKAASLYVHGRLEGMDDGQARRFVELCMSEGMRLAAKVAPNG